MMRWILALLAALAANSASAQPETGSRINRAPLAVTSAQAQGEDAAIVVMNQFARCVARQSPKAATDLLSLPYLSGQQSAAAYKLVGGEERCLGVGDRTLRFRPQLIVGGLAEQLVLDNYKRADVGRFRGMTDEALEASSGAPRNNAEDSAQCVVRRDPEAALDMIRSKPETREEAVLIKRLSPYLGPCLVSGTKMNLTKSAVRHSLAVGLYRMLSTTPQAEKP